MGDAWVQQLWAWHQFYGLVGTAAATLTGLLFVAVSVAPSTVAEGATSGVRAFVTPTVTYFATVLVVSALMSVPTIGEQSVGVLLALGGLGAAAYVVSRGGHRQWRQSNLDRADWLWYVGLPILNYLFVVVAAVGIEMRITAALHAVAAAMIAFLVIGIRNAWDLVIWMAQQTTRRRGESNPPPPTPP